MAMQAAAAHSTLSRSSCCSTQHTLACRPPHAPPLPASATMRAGLPLRGWAQPPRARFASRAAAEGERRHAHRSPLVRTRASAIDEGCHEHRLLRPCLAMDAAAACCRSRGSAQMMWALEYDPDICSTYEEIGAAVHKIEGFKPKVKSMRQFGKYERENMKNRANDGDGPVPISVFLVASVLKENSPKLLQEARGIDDIIRILNNVNGNLDAKRACVVALKLHRKYHKKLQEKKS